ncbi:hypothetical protein HYC85_024594 [Camellia sinensis]|uniref:Uncharacterized protein n=1 Tax=Camellia sinensis TaxID=4442 RepID=A0A7J7GC80_CAMSI|nr:hypothetical protein HYC85_024594 [Camellia sinensis]
MSSPLGPPACEKDAKALRFIEEITRNDDSDQENVLSEILSRNAQTKYLRQFKLSGATDRDTFKSKIPVITYEDLQPEIQQIANGDRSPILSSHLISEFLTSFGTSAGERKLMPTIHKELGSSSVAIQSSYACHELCNFNDRRTRREGSPGRHGKKEAFAWTPYDMPGVDPSFICHQLNVFRMHDRSFRGCSAQPCTMPR